MLAKVGIGLAGLAAIFLVAALLLPLLVNLDRYRSVVAQRISHALGREVTIGSLHLDLWRGLGADINGIQIAQAPGFGSEPFVTADAVRIRVQLLPLLSGHIKVANAVLQRPHIRLVHGPDGRWSTDGMLKPAAPVQAPRAPVEPPRPGKARFLSGLALNQVVVRDGQITVGETGTASVPLTLGDVNLPIRQVAPTDPVSAELRAAFSGAATGRVEASLRLILSDREPPSLAHATLRFRDFEVKHWRAVIPAWEAGAPVSGPLSCEFEAKGAVGRAEFTGTLDLTSAMFRFGSALEKPVGEAARVTLRGRRTDAGLQLDAWAADWRDQHIQGTATIPDLTSPRLTFTAAASKLNIDRLLTRPKHVRGSSGVAWAAPPPSTPPLAAAGRVSVADLNYHGLTLTGATADLRYDAGVLAMPDFQATYQSGTVTAQIEMDIRARVPRVRVRSTMQRVPTEPLLKAFGYGPWKLTSELASEAQVEFTGLDASAILGSARGSGEVRLQRGRVTDYRPLERLADVVGPILAAQGVRVRLNEFEQASGHYSVANGVLRATDFTMVKPEGTVTASGAVGLIDSSLDFDVTLKMARSTIAAKITGTTSHPIIVPKLGRVEQQLNRVLPEGKGSSLQDLFNRFFGR